jgi:hypothetical protein
VTTGAGGAGVVDDGVDVVVVVVVVVVAVVVVMGGAGTSVLGAEAEAADPLELLAVTSTRIVWAMSAEVRA